MDLEHEFGRYEQIKEYLKFIVASDIKMKIIISLNGGPKKLSSLREDVHMNSSTILHSMKQLEERKIVKKELQNYSLSQMGYIIALILIDIINTIHLTKKNENYWINHDIDPIPPDLIKKN